MLSSIVDAETGHPARADGDFRDIGRTVTSEVLNMEAFELELHARDDGFLVVRADGDHEWLVRIQYQLKTSRVLYGPVAMSRERSPGV